MKLAELGNAAASRGWRRVVADRLSAPLAARTRLSPDRARAAVGLALLLRSIVHVIRSVRRARAKAG